PLIQAAHLSQILLALLPLTLSIVIATTKVVLPLTPGLLFTTSPFRPLLIGQTTCVIAIAIPPAIRIVVRTSLLFRDSALLIALPLPLTLLLCLLLALISALLIALPLPLTLLLCLLLALI